MENGKGRPRETELLAATDVAEHDRGEGDHGLQVVQGGEAAMP